MQNQIKDKFSILFLMQSFLYNGFKDNSLFSIGWDGTHPTILKQKYMFSDLQVKLNILFGIKFYELLCIEIEQVLLF